jgi:hypothetical protein
MLGSVLIHYKGIVLFPAPGLFPREWLLGLSYFKGLFKLLIISICSQLFYLPKTSYPIKSLTYDSCSGKIEDTFL